MKNDASSPPSGFFDGAAAKTYDQRNDGLKPISECLHFLIRLTLTNLPADARLLCVGVGTGAEILSLAKAQPGWSFVGVDPAGAMLEIARQRLGEAGLLDRCSLVQGYVDDVGEAEFDGVVCLFVAHFINRADRPAFYRAIHDRLKSGGRFISAEISAELDTAAFPAMLDDWSEVQALMGATPESLAALPGTLRDVLAIVPPADTEALWRDAGFALPIPFFQAFMIRGWHATRM